MYLKEDALEILDKKKTYCGYTISHTIIAKRIQTHAWNYMHKNGVIPFLALNNIATHSYLLSYEPENNKWWIYESRFRGGVQKRQAIMALTIHDVNKFYEEPSFDMNEANRLLGLPYSIKGIARHWADKMLSFVKDDYLHVPYIFGKPKGLFCTEYLDEITSYTLSKHFKLPSYHLIPFHQQLYIKDKSLEVITIGHNGKGVKGIKDY